MIEEKTMGIMTALKETYPRKGGAGWAAASGTATGHHPHGRRLPGLAPVLQAKPSSHHPAGHGQRQSAGQCQGLV